MNKSSQRPWGRWEMLHEEPGFWVKLIEVEPFQRLSLQYHNHRSEKWIIVKGEGLARVGGHTYSLYPKNTIYIPVKHHHRIENTSNEILSFIEIAFGQQLSEDDIVRIQDDYNRT